MISYFWCYLHKTLTLKIQILNVFDSPSAFQGGNISTNISPHSPFLICFDGQLETLLIRAGSQSKPSHFQWTFKSIFHTATIGSAVTDEKCVWNRFTASSGANDRRCVCVYFCCVCVSVTYSLCKYVHTDKWSLLYTTVTSKKKMSAVCLALMNEGNCCHRSRLTLCDMSMRSCFWNDTKSRTFM